MERPTIAVAAVGHHRSGKTTLTAALHALHAGRNAPAPAPALTVAELDRRSGSPPLGVVDGAVRFLRWPNNAPAGLETLTVRSTKITYDSPGRRFVHIDCPGYRCWYKNSARGQAVADALILVVSAPDAVQAQTREHLLLARALGVRDLVVFLNKCDRVVDLEWLDLVERDVRELLDEVGFDGDRTRILRGAAGPALAGEAAWAASLHDLADALETEIRPPAPAPPGPPLLHVDGVHTRAGIGPRVIVQGRLRRGSIRRGDALSLVGLREATAVTVDDLEIFHRKVEVATAGDQLGLLLSRPNERLHRHELTRGQALVGGPAATTLEIRARLRVLSAAEGGRHTPIHRGHHGQLVFGVALTTGWLDGFDGVIEPGEEAEVQVRLRAPLYLEAGMPVILRDGAQGHQRRSGGPAIWAGTAAVGTILAVGAG